MKLKSKFRTGAAESTGPLGMACTPQQIIGSDKWPVLQHAAVPVSVRIPLEGVRLRDVQALAAGAMFESSWPATAEVPLFAAGVALSWCEFEGADQTMAVRVTRLG